jgi:hypothetical protein
LQRAAINIIAEANAIAARFTSHGVVATQQEYPKSAAASHRNLKTENRLR